MEKGYHILILILINMITFVVQQPTSQLYNEEAITHDRIVPTKIENTNAEHENGKVISVRVTSSVAIERGNFKSSNLASEKVLKQDELRLPNEKDQNEESLRKASTHQFEVQENTSSPLTSPDLAGANIEFIKQLNARKEARALRNIGLVNTLQMNLKSAINDTEEITTASSTQFTNQETTINFNEEVPLARSIGISIPLKNQLKDINQNHVAKSKSDSRNGLRLTTVSFNIVHDTPGATYNVQDRAYSETARTYYHEPAKVYSEPAKVYSEPAKFYSEPAKIYSEPSKVYSEPSKVYSEPSKIYSEPSKFYSEPASLHLSSQTPEVNTWSSFYSSTSSTTKELEVEQKENITQTNPGRKHEHLPEQNYEVDEQISVQTNGRSHGVQNSSTDNRKVGYVVEGRQYRKYRVEERTPDGFIVGEYGVVRNKDGDLRGVRYTADGEASPRLIYDALMKFLQLT